MADIATCPTHGRWQPSVGCPDCLTALLTRPDPAGSRYGEWHTLPEGSPWRLRDKIARLVGYHCWDCWRRA